MGERERRIGLGRNERVGKDDGRDFESMRCITI
jgi:hypothetical protein